MFSGPGGGDGASSVGGVSMAHRRLVGGSGGCVAMDGVVVAGESFDDDMVGGQSKGLMGEETFGGVDGIGGALFFQLQRVTVD